MRSKKIVLHTNINVSITSFMCSFALILKYKPKMLVQKIRAKRSFRSKRCCELLVKLTLVHFPMFWHTFSCFDILFHVLTYFLRFWHTFSGFYMLSQVFIYFLMLPHTFSYFLILSHTFLGFCSLSQVLTQFLRFFQEGGVLFG